MNRAQIRDECRALMDDKVASYLISDSELNLRLEEAIKEACIRANLIIDSTTPAICNISVLTGTNQYLIDSRILDIVRIELPSVTGTLGKLGYKALDDDDSGWKTRNGPPSAYAMDLDNRSLTFSHVPIVDETAVLTVSRLPIQSIQLDTDSPEIQSRWHYPLVYWMASLSYRTHDSDLFDPNAAQGFAIEFERVFGPSKTSMDVERNLRSYRRRAKARFL